MKFDREIVRLGAKSATEKNLIEIRTIRKFQATFYYLVFIFDQALNLKMRFEFIKNIMLD